MNKQFKLMLLAPVFCLFAASVNAEQYSAADETDAADETNVEADENQG